MNMNSQAPSFTAGEIANITGGELLKGSPEVLCKGVSTDSRDIAAGNLFVPIVGENFDGHDFIERAIQGGAAGVLIQRGKWEKLKDLAIDVPFICVGDTVKSLGDIASFWRKHFDVPVVAVTGSSGKTTTKEMLASVISLSRNTLKSYGNFNNLIGLPLTFLQLNDSHEAVIVEMGTNRKGEIERLTHIADPDIGVITNVGPAHLEGLKSLEVVAREKGDLFYTMKRDGVAVVNRDDAAICHVQKQWMGKIVTFGMGGNALVRAEGVKTKGEDKTSFVLVIERKRRRIDIAALGKHNVSNALAAAACSWALGIKYDQICCGLEEFRQLPGRMSRQLLKNGVSLIDDTYNANPASMRAAIETMNEIKGENEIIVVMGDMLELGNGAAEMHEEMGRLMAERNIGRIFLKGDLVRFVAEGAEKGELAKDRIVFPATPDMVVDYISSSARRGDSILVKGSRGMRMEEYVQAIIKAFGGTGE